MGIQKSWRDARTSTKIFGPLLIAALVALLVAVVVITKNDDQGEASAQDTSAQTSVTSLRAMTFLGDSYTEGTGADSPQQGWAPTAARELGYQPSLVAQGGAGFLTSNPQGRDTRPLAQRVNDLTSFAPNVVVVAAGLNDANRDDQYSQAQIANAVGSTLGNIRRTLPKSTTVIVVGPFWPSGQPTPSVLAVRDIVKARAAANNMPFIDPIAEEWITGSTDGRTPGNRAQYIGSDGTHPTPNGHVYIASRFVADVKARNLIPVGPPTSQ